MQHGGFISDYSIFTNFKPDHLNWHHDFAKEKFLKLDSSRNTRFFSQSMDCFVPRNDEIKDRTNGENIIIS